MSRANIVKRYGVRLFALILPATFSAAVCAQMPEAPATPPSEVRVLTLEEALHLAETQSFGVKRAEAYRDWVKGRYWEERAAAFPQVTFTADYLASTDKTFAAMTDGLFPARQDSRTYQLQVDQAIFSWGKLGAAVRAARLGLQTADQQGRLARQSARLEVVRAYYDILLARELEAIARKSLALREKRWEQAKARFELGTATEYDVLSARVAAENARPGVVRTAAGVLQARNRLRIALGLEEGEVDAMGTLAVTAGEIPSHEAAFASALSHRPELLNQELRVKVFDEFMKIAKAGNKPTLSFSSAYAQKWLSFGSYEVEGPLWNAGLYLRVPLFDGFRTRGRVLQARSDLQTEEIQQESLRAQLALEVRMAVDSLHAAAGILKGLQATQTQAETLLEMAEKGLEYGVKTLLEVEDAQVNLTQARGNLALARRDYLVAEAALQRAMGTLGE